MVDVHLITEPDGDEVAMYSSSILPRPGDTITAYIPSPIGPEKEYYTVLDRPVQWRVFDRTDKRPVAFVVCERTNPPGDGEAQ